MDTEIISRVERWSLNDLVKVDPVDMDKILLGIVSAEKPERLKRALIEKIANTGRQPQHAATIKAVFEITTQWILNGETEFEQSSGMTVFSSWAKFNKSTLAEFFTKNYLLFLLDGQFNNPGAAVNLIWEILRLLQSHESVPQMCQIVQTKAINFVRNHPQLPHLVAFSSFLLEYKECIPQGDFTATFCGSIIYAISMLDTDLDNPAMFVKDVMIVSGLLHHIWHNTDINTIMSSLKVIFDIISYVDDSGTSREPSFALAALLQHIPTQMVNTVTAKVVSDPQILDRSLEMALMRMVAWLQWPTRKVDEWFVAFLKGLASVHKFTILINVTVNSVEQVFEKLIYPVTRDSAMSVLSHMLLSFQHSPDAFHKIADNIPDTVNHLKQENTALSQKCLERLAELLHCLIQLHPGFPELYEPVLDAIKEFGKPTTDTVKLRLAQSRWKAQCSETTYHSRFAQRSETGKTGLVNLGNTCFMNSVIQALYMCDSFRQSVLAQQPMVSGDLMMKLQQVFAFLSLTQRAAYAPSTFLKTSRPSWFMPRHQQDCSEFLKYLLDQLHEEELKRQSLPVGATERAATLPPPPKSNKKHQRCKSDLPNNDGASEFNMHNAKTMIKNTFCGSLKTSYRCLNCKKESSRVERFIDIPLPFPENGLARTSESKNGKHKSSLAGGGGNDVKGISSLTDNACEPADVTLEDLIEFFLRPEKLEGQNRYFCDHCGGLQDAQRTQNIVETPQYLILTLMRFSYDIKSQSRSKIFTDVKYPKVLTLKSSQENHSPNSKSKLSSIFKKTPSPKNHSRDKKMEQKQDVYCLNGVIVHSGLSSECGHYYCYARHTLPVNQDEVSMETSTSDLNDFDLLQDKWYLFNDGRVSHSNYNSFSNVTKRFGKDTAYVLFYKKFEESDMTSGNVGKNESICVPNLDPPVRPDLREAVAKDNALYIKEQELEGRVQAQRKKSMGPSSAPSWYNYHDPDDKNGPPGNCGGGGSVFIIVDGLFEGRLQ